MRKRLSEMTLEELWELFPIRLCSHNRCWRSWYDEEHDALLKRLPFGTRIYHIGSTAIETIWAKPIVDLLIEVNSDEISCVDKIITDSGYICMNVEADRRGYNKGYTENGFAERVFHLHLRIIGDHDELYFRDYLIAHPDIARDYETLKLSLWKKYEHDRDGYTNAKHAFITKWTQKAKQEYANRY